ncbi:hypothetical protein GXP70_04945 [Paenibacillus lycopersici]|uniref:DUF5666 domain-containing protein n=1 Tax=Paenibacillus lycopersici TaxID=2704462 RepID=A0A6C0FWP6_9BACL|nr:hypothetical protein [Paenibacillus lycopersici]QHT59379.1 hypothetical protein GXP70_04945 [Paenibacillus lycopersici]
MKESLYKSAMDHVKTSEDFNEATYKKLSAEMDKAARTNLISPEERVTMKQQTAMKRKVTGWTVGIAACAVLTLGIVAVTQNQGSPAAPAPTTNSPAATTKPPIMGKVAVNIEGVISEVSADGKSFKVGDLWVSVTDQTQFGSQEPTAVKPSEELLSKEFKVGHIVSGFTSQDVSTGKVTADVIYTNMAPQQ